MAKKIEQPYYQKFKRTLSNNLDEIKTQIEPENSGQLFKNLSPEAIFLKNLCEGVTKFPFRYYQKEAIYTLHSIYRRAINICDSPEEIQKNLLRQKEYLHIEPLLDKVCNESNKKAPYIGFEMATGSGKTMLMGATVFYLNKLFGIKNFLIVTPSSTEIYKKTIRNFQKGTHETVWDDNVPFNFNLVTGDNYQDQKDLFAKDTDANIFIFNIDKFGTNAKKTKVPWESSEWKDSADNTISLLEFLSQNELIIITDEAHHAQSTKAKQVINAFKPKAVIEFTATAVETEKSFTKKNQTIVYKYDIKRFLDDKFGKKVRVLALPGDEHKSKGKKTEISDIEKYKLQTFFLVHLLKKKALNTDVKCRDMKAVGFVKVKNEIAFSEKIEEYIKNKVSTETEHLQVILEKAKAEDTETTNLILDMFEQDYNSNISALQTDIDKVAKTSILLHSKSDNLVMKQFDDIQKNEVEVVIFIDMLNEGIDMPNIYTMVVINDNPSDFKTSVKQIVGRGVRLNKFEREYDEVEDNDLLTHVEKLHIICDKGASFEEVVLEIQKEFGLTDKTFALERGNEEVIDNVLKQEKIKGIQIPKIKIDFKRKRDVNIMDVITNYTKIINDYLASNSYNREVDGLNSKFLKYTPDSFFTEVDLFADEELFHKLGEEQNWHFEQLIISEKDMKKVYGRVISKLKPIPDVPMTYEIFQEYGRLLNAQGFYFYNLDEIDKTLAINIFKDSFTYFYIHYVENEYFELDYDTLDSESDTWLLQNQFKTERIKIRNKDKNNSSRKITEDKNLIELIRNGYYFYGYEHSVYDYDKFDSLPEKQLADYVNFLIEKDKSHKAKEIELHQENLADVAAPPLEYHIDNNVIKPFWIRNDRNIYFEYGTHKYYPDFIFFYNQIIYVIEIKGEVFSNVKKNRLLLELNNVEGIGVVDSYVGMVVFEVQMKKLKDFTKSFEVFRQEAEEYFHQVQKKAELVEEVDVIDSLKYIEYVPALETKQAFNKFISNKEIKSMKWLKTEPGNYPETVFACMIKNDDLGSENKNKWVLFNGVIPSASDLIGKVIISNHKKIQATDYNLKNTIIRVFNVQEESINLGMFQEQHKQILLTDIEGKKDPIIISADIEEFKVVGVKYDLNE
jgi:superfamily II DNA or RNA helicase